MLLYSRIRYKVFECDLFAKGRKKKLAAWFNYNMMYIIITSYSVMFVGIVVLIYSVFGQKDLLSGLLLGAAVVLFIIFQLPRLLKPNLYVVFLPGREENKGYEDIPKLNVAIKIKPQQEKALLFFRVTNLGLNRHHNCTFWFCFPEGFEPLTDQNLYDGVDFAKVFKLQRQNRCAHFLPDKNYLSIAPGNHLVFPIWIQIPKTLNNTAKEMLVLATSETRWGEFSKKLEVHINQESQDE